MDYFYSSMPELLHASLLRIIDRIVISLFWFYMSRTMIKAGILIAVRGPVWRAISSSY